MKAEEIVMGLTGDERLFPTEYWDAFCEKDPLPIEPEEYEAWMENRGLAELDWVNDSDLESAFAEECGIVPGGMVFRLTPLGLEVRSLLQSMKEVG